MRDKKNLKKLLNLNYLDLTNRTICYGKYDLPSVYCRLETDPDYIALYSQPCDYHKTENTVVSFYDYDSKFDGVNGLYNAIYYKNEKRLNEFKNRFSGVKYFISPDYTMAGDVPLYHNLYRYGQSREVALWFTLELGVTTIPNIPCSSILDLEFICDGLADVDTVAFSTKGRNSELDKKLITKSLILVLDRLPKLKKIIVYDVSRNNKSINELFAPAIDRGIRIIIPDNSLKIRNILGVKFNV